MPGASPNSKPSRSGQAKKRFQPAIGRDFGAVDEVETKSRGYLMRAIVSLNGGVWSPAVMASPLATTRRS